MTRVLLVGIYVLLSSALTACNTKTTGTFERGYDETGDRATLVDGVWLKSYGVPNRHLKNTTAAVLDPERGPGASILQGTHSHGIGRMVRFTPETGETTYLPMRGALGSWAIAPVGKGEAYAGSHQTGFLFHLMAGADSLIRVELPRPTELAYDWVFSATIADDEWVYFGTYPEGALLRFEPHTGAVEELGQLVEADDRAQYLRHLSAPFPGKLYAGMGAVPELIEIDLESGRRTTMLPPRFRDRSFVYYTGRFRDYLLAVVSPNDRLLFFDPDSRRLIRELAPPGGSPGFLRFTSESFVTHNGLLYFGTADDDRLWRYDYDNDEFELVHEGIGAPIGLASGRYLFTLNARATYSVFDLEAGEIVLRGDTMFEGDGMQVHAIAEGPEGDVMGGIYINQGFFRQYLDPDSLESPGTSVTFGGQIDQLLPYDGRIYLAHYTSARISRYDPDRPWNPATTADANPRVLGSISHDQDRFPTMVHGPDGKVYLGSIPKYGKLGGALVVLDPADDTWTVHRNVVPDHSVLSLVTHPDGLVYGGTGITGGLGSAPTAEEAVLFAWNPDTGKKVLETSPVPGAAQIWGLDLLPDGNLVGTADSVLFVYDVESGEVIRTAPGVPEVIKKIVASHDGWIYGLNEYRFFRFDPALEIVEMIDEYEGYWDSLVELEVGRLFVARGAELMEVIR